MPRFTRLKGVSDERRLPRLGKIRLGIKKQSRGGKEYPAEVDYFVVPPEVAAVYGEQPKKLDVMLPVEDVDVVMPVALKYYKATGLFCTGDGERAVRRGDAGEMVERDCPCEFLDEKKCKRMAVINVILPKVNMGGVYQVVTGSWNSIVNFQSSMDYIRALIGRSCMVPLTLERVPEEIQHTDASGATSKQPHYILRLLFHGDIDFINRLKDETKRILAGPTYRLPAPDVNPVLDPVDVIVDDEAAAEAPPDDAPRARVLDAESKPVTDAAPPAAPPKPSRRSKSTPTHASAPATAATPSAPPATTPAPAAAAAPAAPSAAPAPAPTSQPAAAGQSLSDVPGLWRKVQTCFGEKAETFWRFLLNVNGYFGVENSAEVPIARATEVVQKIGAIAAMAPDARRHEAMAWWDDLRIEVDERLAIKSESAAQAQA